MPDFRAIRLTAIRIYRLSSLDAKDKGLRIIDIAERRIRVLTN